LRTRSREFGEHVLTISADGTTGSRKNASANSQTRTRSLRPTSGKTWMRSAVPLLEGPRWPLRPRSAASDLTRQAPPREVARTAVLSPRHHRPEVPRGLARSRESTRYVVFVVISLVYFVSRICAVFVVLVFEVSSGTHSYRHTSTVYAHMPFAICLLYCRQSSCKVESLLSSNVVRSHCKEIS
jgi:hypothetical protein